MFSALLRTAQRLDPVLEQERAGGRERVAALRRAGGGLVPRRADEAFLLERAQQAIEVSHLDALLAGQVRQPLEEVVAVCRTLAEQQQQRRLGEALDAREHAPVAAVMAPRTRASHRLLARCKKHMLETLA